MSQHDMVIDNASGLNVRTDMNAAMQALASCSAGPTAPATTYAGQLWLNLSGGGDGVLMQRNQANLAWVPVLLPPEFRFPQADLFFGARVAPNRFVFNNAFDGSGSDVAVLDENGIMTIGGPPVLPAHATTKSYVDAIGVPVGTVIYVAMVTPPTNFLKCNGASVLRNAAPALFTAIGVTFGAADSSHFNVPELRGEFVRGWDDGRTIDAGRALGTAQASLFASHTHVANATCGINSVGHTHTFSDTSSSTSTHTGHTHPIAQANYPVEAVGAWAARPAGTGSQVVSGLGGAHSHTVAVSGTTSGQSANHVHDVDVTVTAAGGADTRPRNVALLACIKYQ